MSKKEWHKPQIIILARGKLQESILAACKSGWWDGPNTGMYGGYLKCHLTYWDEYTLRWVTNDCHGIGNS
jgi:hypothetical protein